MRKNSTVREELAAPGQLRLPRGISLALSHPRGTLSESGQRAQDLYGGLCTRAELLHGDPSIGGGCTEIHLSYGCPHRTPHPTGDSGTTPPRWSLRKARRLNPWMSSSKCKYVRADRSQRHRQDIDSCRCIRGVVSVPTSPPRPPSRWRRTRRAYTHVPRRICALYARPSLR